MACRAEYLLGTNNLRGLRNAVCDLMSVQLTSKIYSDSWTASRFRLGRMVETTGELCGQ
jgi:hypothetical protein